MACNTALVKPPSALTTVKAFSNAFFVRMSSGLRPWRNMFTTAAPVLRQSSSFAGETAFCAELLGRLMPSASIALDMVFAAYNKDAGKGTHCVC